jgi:hypothetical protein
MSNEETQTSDEAQTPKEVAPKPARRSWVKWALLGVGGVLGVLFATFLILGFAVDFGGIAHKRVVAALPMVKQKLGREVTVGKISLKLLPSVRLRIEDIQIQGQPGKTGVLAEPLLQIGSVEAVVKVWPAVLSFGRRIVVTKIEISNGKVQVARLTGGRLSYEDVLDQLATQPKDDTPLTEAEIDRLAGIAIERAALQQSSVWFHDLSGPKPEPPLKIDAIELQLLDGQLFGESKLSLKMALFQLTQNFHLSMVVGPLPRDLKPEPSWTVLRKLELKLDRFQIEPLLQFLPDSTGTSLDRALVEADLLVQSPKDSGKLSVTGKAGLRGLQLRDFGAPAKAYSQSKGQPTDVSAFANVELSMLSGDIRVDRARLDIANMSVTAEADLRNLWKSPAVHSLRVSSTGLKLERLLAMLPKTTLPDGMDVQGPLAVTGSASGTPTAATVNLGVDLGGATLVLPMLRKPAGMPFHFGLAGALSDARFKLERFGLVLGPLSLLLHGDFKSNQDVDLTLDSGTVDLDKLLRLLPTVNEGMASGKKKKGPTIDGDLRISGSMSKKGDVFSAQAKVKMQNANFEQDGADLSGSADFSAEVKKTPTTSSVDAHLDLTQAALHVSGSVDKNRGVPMRLALSAQKNDSSVQIKQAQLELPGGLVRLVGSADLAKKHLDMKVPLVDLDLSKLSRVIPSLAETAGGGLLDSKVTFSLSVAGNPERLDSVSVKLDTFKMQVAGGTVVGGASVTGLSEPKKASFDFSADYLDLDKILGEKKAGDDEDSTPSKEVEVPKFLKRLEADGKIKVASGKLKGQSMKDFVLEAALSGGKLLLRVFRIQALGGNILLSGTNFDLGPSKPRFSIKAKLDKVDVQQAISFKSRDLAKKLQGRGSVDLSADGQGLRWEDIAPRIVGQLDMGLTDGKLTTAKLGSQLVGPLLQRAGVGQQTGDEREMSMKNLTANFRISDGRMHTTKPMVYQTEQGGIQLTGSIGLDKTLDLLGDLQLQPQVVSAMTGGKLVPAAPVPVALRILGSLNQPQFQLADPVKTVAALVSGIAKGRGQEFLNQLGGQKAGGALGGALGNVLSGQKNAGQGGGLPSSLPGKLPTNLPSSLPSGLPGTQPQTNTSQPAQPGVQQLQDAQKRLQQGGGLPGLFRR